MSIRRSSVAARNGIGETPSAVHRAELCPLCGCEESAVALARGPYTYRACEACRGIWLSPLPSEHEMLHIFSEGYFKGGGHEGYDDYERDEILHRCTAQERLALLSRLCGDETGAVLDVGCATGFLLDEARRAGWQGRGVELSGWAAERARARGLEVYDRIEAAADEGAGQYRAVTMFQLLMHVRHPNEILSAAYRCLAPGGLLLLETWDLGSRVARTMGARWSPVAPPSVLFLHSRENLDLLLDRNGFILQDIGPVHKRVSVGFALGLIADKYRPLRPLAGSLLTARIQRWSVRYPFRDLIYVAARRI